MLPIAPQVGARRVHGDLRRGAGRDIVQVELLECRQRAAVERSGEGGAAGALPERAARTTWGLARACSGRDERARAGRRVRE